MGGVAAPRVMATRVSVIAWAASLLLALLFLPFLDLLEEVTWSRVAWAATGSGTIAEVLVEKETVAVGEPLMLQIRVEGSDLAPGTEPPNMTGLADFAVEYLGGQSNNSSSLTIINGKVNKVESFGYIHSYRMTPKRVGRFEIPPVNVPLGPDKSRTVLTKPVKVTVVEPEATDDFHLEVTFSKTNFYLGEPVILTVVWYLGRDVESVTFNVPVLQDEVFVLVDPKVDQDPRKQYFQIQVGGANVVAEKGTGTYRGKEYTTLFFRKVLFARKAGTFETPEASVSCKALTGFSGRQPRRSPFDDDFFNPGRRALYKTFVSRSQPVTLTVLALPEQGKPPNFTGWVGRFQVEASASPTEVNIGEPVTVTVSVSGSEYLDKLELPALARDPAIEQDFKIPDEIAAGVVRGGVKQFTQTLRPKHAQVKAVPPLKIPFFNPDAGRYEVAQSEPIPLKVKATRVLTSADVEGQSGETTVRKSELENRSQGIAYNYEGPEVLEKQVFLIATIVRSPLWLASMVVPFLGFVVLLVVRSVRQRQTADPVRSRARRAFAGFKQRVAALGTEAAGDSGACAGLLDAMRAYLGNKLRRNGSALTFEDVEGKLKERRVDAELMERLRVLFAACEQGSYGGMALQKPFEELAREAIDVIRSLDRRV